MSATAYRHPNVAMGALAGAGALAVGVGAALGPAPGIAAVVAVAVGALVIRRPDLGALGLVALTPALSGLRRGLPVPGLRVSEVLIFGVSALILLTVDRESTRPWRLFDWAAVAYAVASLALGVGDLIARELPISNETLRTILNPVQYLLLYRAVLVALPSAEGRARALRLILVVGALESAVAILQAARVPGVRAFIPTLTGVDIDTISEGAGARATGTFPHWQVLAGYLLWVSLIATALLVDGTQRVMRRAALLGVLGLAFAALLTTLTLGAMLGVVVGALALAAWSGRWERAALALLLGGAIAVVAFYPTLDRRIHDQFDNPAGDRPAFVPRSVDYRYEVWTQQYFPVLEGRWATGYGPDLPPEVRFPFTESIYIQLLMRGGVPLLAVYLLLTAALIAAAVRARDDPEPERRTAARTLTVGLSLLLVLHFLEPYFILTGIAQLIWITAGLALAEGAPAPRARRVARSPARRSAHVFG